MSPAQQLKPGDQIKILEGPFAEMEAGKPGRALQLGRDLYLMTMEKQENAERAGKLLAKAYRADGREKLAEIVEVHTRHREEKSVGMI